MSQPSRSTHIRSHSEGQLADLLGSNTRRGKLDGRGQKQAAATVASHDSKIGPKWKPCSQSHSLSLANTILLSKNVHPPKSYFIFPDCLIDSGIFAETGLVPQCREGWGWCDIHGEEGASCINPRKIPSIALLVLYPLSKEPANHSKRSE